MSKVASSSIERSWASASRKRTEALFDFAKARACSSCMVEKSTAVTRARPSLQGGPRTDHRRMRFPGPTCSRRTPPESSVHVPVALKAPRGRRPRARCDGGLVLLTGRVPAVAVGLRERRVLGHAGHYGTHPLLAFQRTPVELRRVANWT